jgi:hypothetical protein
VTEAEWLASADPEGMYRFLYEHHGASRRKVGKRKTKLFACASCRLYGDALSDPRSVAAVEHAEALADGTADPTQTAALAEGARRALLEATKAPRSLGVSVWNVPAVRAAEAAFNVVTAPAGRADGHWAYRNQMESDAECERAWREQRRVLADLLRDIFGNPFRPVAVSRKWLTSDVRALARGVYDDRAFDRMPILADALQDAGCDNDGVLSHCRGGGPHVRGCWVVDMVLGKG